MVSRHKSSRRLSADDVQIRAKDEAVRFVGFPAQNRPFYGCSAWIELEFIGSVEMILQLCFSVKHAHTTRVYHSLDYFFG